MRQRATAIALAALLGASGLTPSRPALGEEQGGSPPAIIPAKAYGPPFPTMETPPRDDHGGMAPIVQRSVGCIALGSTAMAATLGAGGTLNATNVIAGGVVLAQNAAALYLGLAAIVFATYCSIGATLTPLYLYLTSEEAPPPPPPQAAERRPAQEMHPAVFGPTARSSGVLGDALARRREQGTAARAR